MSRYFTQAHIDRANIGNAKIEGMVEDLGMTGIQYNIALSLFFIPYILLEGMICFRFSNTGSRHLARDLTPRQFHATSF